MRFFYVIIVSVMKKIIVNMASESDISVQGHGVHTAYEEMLSALSERDDVDVIRGVFKGRVKCDVYHLHTIGFNMWRKIFDRSAKKVVSAHVIPDSLVGSIILAKYWRCFICIYMRWFYNKADKVLAVSETVKKSLTTELKVPASKVEVLYNTVDMSRYKTTPVDRQAARKSLGLDRNSFIVVGVGQIQPRKRLDVFQKMAQAMPDVQFIWVGGIPFGQLGAEYRSMQKLIASAPKNLIITDVIPHAKVKKYLQAADVFCLPAEQENHPMCVLEAAGAGLPIILRNIPEYGDTFAEDALLCKSYDDFIAAVDLLKTDKSAQKKWREHSKNIADRFDSSTAADRLMEIYRGLLDE